mmetsp:Transcript_29571/g.26154  ORF Transcript_29571/g.26154 Transcript_29571/m.26154 type:complete len:80 (-) Transcript_29571:31-270(-)
MVESEEEEDESVSQLPRHRKGRKSNMKKKRNLDEYVSDQSDSEFDSLKKTKTHHPKHKGSKDSMPMAKPKRNTKPAKIR